MAAQQNTLAQTPGTLNCSFGTKLRRLGAGLAAAAQLGGGAALPAVGGGASLVAPVTAVASAAFLASTQTGDSAVMIAPGTTLPGQAYIDAANPYTASGAVVALGITDPITSNTGYASAFKISDNQYLTASHVFTSSNGGSVPNSNVNILVGSNYFSPDATLQIQSTIPLNDIGLTIITVSQSYSGTIIPIADTSPENGSTLSFIGFGQPQLSATSTPSFDGFGRMFQARAIDPSGSFNNLIYGSSSTTGISSSILGFGSNGDSGGLVLNSSGQAVGIMTSASNNRTTWVDLTVTGIPEPRTILMALLAACACVAQRKRPE